MEGIPLFSLVVELNCKCNETSRDVARSLSTAGGSSSYSCDGDENALNEACAATSEKSYKENALFAVSASSVKFFLDQQQLVTSDHQRAGNKVSLIAVFVPPALISVAIETISSFSKSRKSENAQQCKSVCWTNKASEKEDISRSILSNVHNFFENAMVRGIINQRNNTRSAADVLLIDVPSKSNHHASFWVSEAMNILNGIGMVAQPNAVIKVLPISNVAFRKNLTIITDEVSRLQSSGQQYLLLEIPPCPVCLHRIDPSRLGLPKPKTYQLCSKFCPTTISSSFGANLDGGVDVCGNQRFLSPWQAPSACTSCQVINDQWNLPSSRSPPSTSLNEHDTTRTDTYCNRCALQETLWVCLNCGFVGCGRYSQRHASEHFDESKHPYSLELATLRIWDYFNGEFVHRGDLLECPSVRRTNQLGSEQSRSFSQVHPYELSTVGENEKDYENYQHTNSAHPNNDLSVDTNGVEKSSKKANMLGEEYEALLQSALEEQAQHYEGELSRLRAELTAEHVDEAAMTDNEAREIEALRKDIVKYREEMNQIGKQLLDAQAQEAGYKASSQRLLREQSITNDLLDKIRQEAAREQEDGKQQIEDLEQQIADLSANLRMRDQFLQDQELSNAQIVATATRSTSSNKKHGKRGKKARRFFRS